MPKGYPNPKSDDTAVLPPNDANWQPSTGENHQTPAPSAEVLSLQAEIAKLKAKMELREEIRVVVSEEEMDRRRAAFGKPTAPEQFVMPKPNGEKLIKMTLDHHYSPTGFYEVVGYNQEEVVKKRADGSTIVVTPAAFIPDVVKPHHIGGVGFQNKIWAGTVLKVQETEARLMRKNGIASYELD